MEGKAKVFEHMADDFAAEYPWFVAADGEHRKAELAAAFKMIADAAFDETAKQYREERDSLRAEVERLKKELGEARCSLAETEMAYESAAKDREDLRVQIVHLKTVAKSSRRAALEEAAGIAEAGADLLPLGEYIFATGIAAAIRAAAKEER